MIARSPRPYRVLRAALAAVGLALLLIGGVVDRAAAQGNQRIAFVNSEKILEQYRGTQTAMATFRKDVDAWNAEAQQRKRDLDALEKELSQQSAMLSDDKRREKEQDYQRKLTEYDQYVQSLWGPNGKISERNEEILRPIIAKIQGIVARIAEDEDYDLILDMADGNILYGAASLDLTTRLIDEMNAELGEPAGTGQP